MAQVLFKVVSTANRNFFLNHYGFLKQSCLKKWMETTILKDVWHYRSIWQGNAGAPFD